jgi:signal transduction histidine kinase
MTIKRSLFFSNIRMIVISVLALGLAFRIVLLITFGTSRPDKETIDRLHETTTFDPRITVLIMVFAIFLIFISIINIYFTHRMAKRIVKPLEPLSKGVQQIYANNFAYRINYQGNDEFRPVCEAFNEMAAKLETSTAKQRKDEANRRELIAGISHDLRTPLTAIKGYIEGIETGVASTPEMQKKYLAIIKNKAKDMEHIIEQLFLFSKLDMDEFPIAMRNVDISLAISDMIEDSATEYASRGLSIKFAEMAQNIHVSADVLMLRNVIINILENSAKYKTKEQGQVEISIAAADNFILLRLADDGPGVQADMLPKLFDVFYRTDPSRSKLGSGLGLAISVKIIERMNGSIHAELPAAGGLAVVIRLPLLQEAT